MLKVLLFVFLFPFMVVAQNRTDSILSSLHDSLTIWGKKMQRGENDSVRNGAAVSFEKAIENILNDSSSFNASFDAIKTLSVKNSPDNTFRLYTWTYPNNDGSKYYYFGYLQTYNAKTRKTSLFTLNDSSDVIEKPKSTKLKPERWFGAVYYSILKNVKDKKTYYTLLGWHGKNTQLTQKIADVLYFDKGQPVFGYPLFKVGKVYNNRILFQYDSQAVMSLKYDEDRKMIVFDHISNVGGKLGPDGSYDAFKYNKEGRWELIEDVDVDAGFKPKTSPKAVPDSQLNEKEQEIKEKK
jgi:hypothetical protein